MPNNFRPDPTVKYKRKQAFPQSSLGEDDIVILNLPSGKYHGLKGSAIAIWDLLDKPRSIDEICTGLVEKFDVDPAACRSDVEEFVGSLLEEALIQPDA